MAAQGNSLSSIPWVSGVWLIVGAELLVALYFASTGAPPSHPLPGVHLSHSSMLLDLAKHMALVNVVVVLALWLRCRSSASRGLRAACIVAAAALLLGPLAMRQLSRNAPASPVTLERAWELGPDGEYHELEMDGSPANQANASAPQVARPPAQTDFAVVTAALIVSGSGALSRHLRPRRPATRETTEGELQ